jgi:hypothetical protein
MKFFEVVFSNGLKAGIDAPDAKTAERTVKKVFKTRIANATVTSVKEIQKREE